VRHSPGPWTIDNGRTIKDRTGQNVSGCVVQRMGRANARLIAAAPLMLEALKNIENDDERIPKAIWDMRNAAITAAEEG
jgi:hypothetical protein